MASIPTWFNHETYMANKLTQVQSVDPAGNWTMPKLVAAFAENGFIGADGAYNHFMQFGAAEDVAPNASFNAMEYYAAKAAQFYNVAPNAVTELQIADIKAIINSNGMNAWTHYQQFGSAEGVNPSNAFDADAYLAAKAVAMGDGWTAEKIAEAIKANNMTVLDHYLTYAGKGEGEVAEGATFPVPDDKKVPSGNDGQTYTLTTGIDTIVGTSGNDTINATNTATSVVLGSLDSVDGGAGTDTLNIADTATTTGLAFSLPTGFTINNVENINVTTNGGINLNLANNAAVTSIKGLAAGTANSTITASSTADVDLTVAGAATATVTGGKAVAVTGGTGVTSVTGKGLTSVTVKGGGAVTIDNLENTVAATSAKGTTLTSVTLDSVDADSGISGEGLTDVTVKGATTAARTVSITNAKANHALTVNVDGTGYTAAGAEAQTVVVDAAATSITVNATGSKSSLALTGSTLTKTVNITGTADLKLNPLASATKIDGSAATGSLTLGTLNAATVNVSTGSGKDSLTLSATAKATVDTGAGDDTVTLASAVAAGSTINLGAGNDKLLVAGGSVAASTTAATTVIDGGDGIDTVSAALINVGNAAQFKNFELLNLDSTTGLDMALLTANNSLTGLTMSSASHTATYQNASKAMGLSIDFVGDNSSAINTLAMSDVTGTADAYTITFAADNSTAASAPAAANVKAGTLVTAGIENFNIVSGGAKAWNSITLGADSAAQSVVVTGDANLDLTFATGFGSAATGVSLIDGSVATGKLSITTTNVIAATAGLTVKGGSADDTITLGQKATVDAGAGNDNIIVHSTGGTITTGAGNDMVDVKGVTVGSTTAPVFTTITDFTVGSDKLTFADKGTETFTATKIDVSSATALFGGSVNALDLAATANGSTDAAITWFQYNGDTYIVADMSASTSAFDTTDNVVKLSGLHDLSGLTAADFTFA